MQIQTRHAPSFAVARCTLAPRETLRAESGAMMATSAGVAVEARMEGGLMRSLRRGVLGGESLFITTFTAPDAGGWVDVAANLPGDVVDSGHMVAYDEGVQSTLRRVASTMQSLKSGEGLVFEFTGPGEVWTQSRNPSWLLDWIATGIGGRS
jgi:uncharacterized protein (AIM24 family)